MTIIESHAWHKISAARRPSADLVDAIVSPSLRNTLLVALLIHMQWGFPLVFFGIPTWLSIHISSAVIFLLVAFRLYSVRRYGLPDSWETGILIFIGYCYFVTVVSNMLIFQNAMSEWLASLTYPFPLMLVLAGRPLKIRAADIVNGVILATFIGALLVFVDHFVRLAVLSDFVHYSTLSGSARRVVFMHNESVFAFVVLVSLMLSVANLKRKMGYLIALAFVGFSLLFVSESRLAVGAAAIGSIIYFLFLYKGRNKVAMTAIGLVSMLVIVPFVFDEYIRSVVELSYNVKYDRSISFRNIEIEHFASYFNMTNGFGYGLMTISPNKTNIISQSLFVLAEKYQVDYWISMVDIRIYSALFQFGYIGLGAVLFLTYLVIRYPFSITRRGLHPYRHPIGAMGAAALGFMISPLPMNLFTVDNTYLLGGLAFALTAFASREERLLRAAIASVPQEQPA